MKFNIYKGERPSDGARNLATSLEATILKANGSAYRGRPNTAVINWGVTGQEAQRLFDLSPNGYNNPRRITLAVDKLKFFNLMAEEAPGLTPAYTTNIDDALALVRQGGRMFARTVLSGHSGKGIELITDQAELRTQVMRNIIENNVMPVHSADGDMPPHLRATRLFTQGVMGKRIEFRVHVLRGQVILTQVKLRREGAQQLAGYNTVVRNVASGWVYGVNTVEEQPGVEASRQAAIQALAVLQLDFGAIDVVYQEQGRRAYVLEVNTAPGLDEDGSALTAYVEAFKRG